MTSSDLQMHRKATRLLEAGRLDQARQSFEDLIARQPGNLDYILGLAAVHARSGHLEKAELAFMSALKVRPDYQEAYFRLGFNLNRQGRPDDAVAYFQKGLSLDPGSAMGHNGLGLALDAQGECMEAVKSFQRAIELAPDKAQFYYNYGNALHRAGRLKEPLIAFRRAIALQPDIALYHSRCGDILVSMGELDDAQKTYEQAVRLDPGLSSAVTGQAIIWGRRRQPRKALDILDSYARERVADPVMASAYGVWVESAEEVARAISWLEYIVNLPDCASDQKARALFALGNLFDKDKEYDKAFQSYSMANALRNVQYQPAQVELAIDKLCEVFNEDCFGQERQARQCDRVPVFIVGMPRSGSTLVEQILASHSRVDAMGEQLLMSDLARRLSNNPVPLASLSAESLDQLATEYLEALGDKSRPGRYFTDKLPLNFMNLGLISMIFPGAKIIHVCRNPVDTCLSCYFQDFSGDHPYAFNLRSAGHFFRQYCRVMSHWKKVLPLQIFELHYEELVADPRSNIRDLLAFCSLEYEESCLNFQENKRVVSTASANQVVKPLYQSSIDRQRHYKKHLQPLLLALGDIVTRKCN